MGLGTTLAELRHRTVRALNAPALPGFAVAAATTLRQAVGRVADGCSSVSAATGGALSRTSRSPAFGVAIIACLIFTGVDGAAAPQFPGAKSTVRGAAITPVAAVTRASTDPTGPLVVAVQRPKVGFHIGEATASAPPPSTVVNTPGALGIPMMALAAYRNAERMMATADPYCGISWNLLAGIGRIESGHANGGATDAHGTVVRPIYGPTLDGSLPGNEVVVQGNTGGRISYARAMGPMQFLPGTWAHYASDGDGDGKADPQNLYDSTLAAARYLCSGGLNLRDQSQVLSSILRYNNSMPYAQNVLGWAAAYATGVVPVDLPPLTGPAPPLADAHLENAEGLGPNLPLNMHGLPSTDPLARVPLIDLTGGTTTPNQPVLPWQQTAPVSTYMPSCTVICIGQGAGVPQQSVNTPPPSAVPPAAPAPTSLFPNLFPAPQPPAAPPAPLFPWAPAAPPASPAPLAPAG